MSLAETYELNALAAVVADEVDLVSPKLRFALVVWDADRPASVYATSNDPDTASVCCRMAMAITGITNTVKAAEPAGHA
ncbi:MAG TPA: hypothetical protein VHT68_04730 [Pseudolabrys sp.]|jgi:adenosine/AMP kinase|nr:hypothetical protein [Pseudolabrys sp.]